MVYYIISYYLLKDIKASVYSMDIFRLVFVMNLQKHNKYATAD